MAVPAVLLVSLMLHSIAVVADGHLFWRTTQHSAEKQQSISNPDNFVSRVLRLISLCDLPALMYDCLVWLAPESLLVLDKLSRCTAPR